MVTDTQGLSLIELSLSTLLPLIFVIPVAYVYRWTQRECTYSVPFVHGMFLFASLSSVMTLIIGNNIARAFGLIGALSIIRFRNALKSPLDAIYIFWCLAIGMACGTGYHLAAAFIVSILCVAALSLHYFKFGETQHIESVLRFTTEMEGSHEVIHRLESLLKENGSNFRQVNEIHHPEEKRKAYVYILRSKKPRNLEQTCEKIKELDGIRDWQKSNHLPSIFAA